VQKEQGVLPPRRNGP